PGDHRDRRGRLRQRPVAGSLSRVAGAPVAAELALRDVAAQAHPAVAAIERAAPRAAAPARRVRGCGQRPRLRAVTAQAAVLAVTRRAGGDVAARLASVQVGPGALRRPARRVERALGIRRAELGVAAHADAFALVAADAERLRSVARRAVGLA